jgi:hypothetical protein
MTLAGSSIPAGAAVLGGAGEALLIPLVVWSGGDFNDKRCDAWIAANGNPFNADPVTECDVFAGYTPAVDTLIELWVPGSVGFDDIPNIYTARNTTPTNVPSALTPADPALTGGGGRVHWYFFNKRSVEVADGIIPVTPNDGVLISWTEAANGQYENQAGYMVIANESARNGTAATFSFFGNAWLVGALHLDPADNRRIPGIGLPLVGSTIPVLGMNDGVDGPVTPGNTCAQPDVLDSVKYRGGIPCAVSPLIAGFRTNRSNGVYDFFAMDLALSNRLVPTIHVIWSDQNLNNTAAINKAYPGNTAVPNPIARVDVYDMDELSCSTTVRLPNELNTLWIPPAYETNELTLKLWNQPFKWMTNTDLLCVVSDQNPASLITAGFVQYSIDEYIDTGVGKAESSMFAFGIKLDGALVNNDALPLLPDAIVLMLESTLGHDLGTFSNF